ncbi:hypothetical protein TNIN_308091 [Trichonephila inaurata madagascariensis]|uniref:Uncharacterized protein n=1 Tax=Trichonephila inaurata madagascariensis TaxID=2747483 RepID=A0A8X6WMV8_9ARAC|nr:hypothetical protein TNIN_308091 [Trichonephila inaurata madagascariensis]
MPANKDGSFRLQPRRLRSKWKLSWLYDDHKKIRWNNHPFDPNNRDSQKKSKSGNSNIYVHFNFNASTSEACTENKTPGTDGTPLPNRMDRNAAGTSKMNVEKVKSLRTCCSAYDNSLICLSGNPALISKYGHLIREICSEMYAFM